MTEDTIVNPTACACCGDLLRARFDRRRFLHLTAAGLAAAAFPSLAFGASGNYDAMLLTCIDPRFPEPTIKYMESRNMVGKYSQFTFAGAAIGVVAPAFKAWRKTFWDNLAASVQLHNIPRVIALDHRDCGAAKIAYGEAKVATRDLETQTHKAALMQFRKEVGKRHPKMQVELSLIDLDGKVETFS
ncbi:MAG TPA: carbonic anhydrase [Pseudolabrys sp.]|nr:carbonic anhydrase [Pseudolabrys sp.]